MGKPILVEKLNLEMLFDFIERHNVAIPEFQRGYVWKEKQVKDLFDSLIKKYPIGSIIIWKTTQKIGQRNLLVKKSRKPKEKYLILDGQQRLLSLYYLCKQKEFLDVKDLFEEIYEHKEKHLLEFEHFYFENKAKPELNYSKEKNFEFNFKEFKRRLGSNYEFPIIIVSIENYQKAIEIFERLNQAGTRISTEAIFLSETWNKKTNLGRILRKWKNDNKNKLSGKLDSIIFIHTLAIIIQLEKIKCGKDEYNPNNVDISLRQLKNIAEKIKEEKGKLYEKELNKVLSAASEAMSFLEREYNIQKLNELPSQTMVTILCVFFYYQDDPSKKQRKELRKWFWRSSLGNRYVGSGYNENVRRDPIKMKELAEYNKSLNLPPVQLWLDDLKNTDIRSGRSTIRNSIKLMLWDKEPRWINGDPINPEEIESGKRKKEDDHFYPYDYYKAGVIGNEINSILNLCFLPKTENARKKKILPSKWLEERKKELMPKIEDEKLFFTCNLLPFKSIEELKSFEDGLLIKRSTKPRPKLFKKKFDKFLKNRFKLFKKELNRLQRGTG